MDFASFISQCLNSREILLADARDSGTGSGRVVGEGTKYLRIQAAAEGERRDRDAPLRFLPIDNGVTVERLVGERHCVSAAFAAFLANFWPPRAPKAMTAFCKIPQFSIHGTAQGVPK